MNNQAELVGQYD